MKKSTKFHLAYEPSQKVWKASNSNLFYTHKDKRNVLLWVLKQEHPDLWGCIHGIACACSQDGNGKGIPLRLIDRLIKAAQLLSKGKVFKEWVLSQNGNEKTYVVRREGTPPVWTCTCKDFRGGGFETAAYGTHCKHTLTQLIAYFVGLELRPYNPAKPQYTSQSDFLQRMDGRQANRLQDPAYLNALEKGGDALFWYHYQEILTAFTEQLYRNAQHVLHGERFERADAQHQDLTAAELRSEMCDEFRFERIFEIPELNGEDYGEFWLSLYDHTRNGRVPRLKAELIRAFEELL